MHLEDAGLVAAVEDLIGFDELKRLAAKSVEGKGRFGASARRL